MRRTRTLRRSALYALLLLVPLGCGDDDGGSPTDPADPPDPPAATDEAAAIDVAADSLAFPALGDSTQLAAVVRDADGNEIAGAAVSWTSTDPAVATVTPAGWVVARRDGTTAVTASAGEVGTLADTVAVVVAQAAATVEVSPGQVTLAQGDTARLSAVVQDSNGFAVENAVAVWSSANPGVAAVDSTGLVVAVRGGGRTEVVASAGEARDSAAVAVLDRLVFLRQATSEIFTMNADGSAQTRLTDNHERDHSAAWSPDGTRIAFMSQRDGNGDIYVMDADGGDQTSLTKGLGGTGPVWSPDGGRIAFISLRTGDYDIYVMNADGSGLANLTADTSYDAFPAWSPEGSRIAFVTNRDGNDEIYVMNADGSGLANLTNSAGADDFPVWSPDGTKITFMSDRDGNVEVYVMNSDGSGAINLTNDAANDGSPAWSPDGSKIAFASFRGGQSDIYVMNAGGDGLVNLTNDATYQNSPAWSPDGTRIAFAGFRLEETEIFVMNADGGGRVRLTNNATRDGDPAWRPWP